MKWRQQIWGHKIFFVYFPELFLQWKTLAFFPFSLSCICCSCALSICMAWQMHTVIEKGKCASVCVKRFLHFACGKSWESSWKSIWTTFKSSRQCQKNRITEPASHTQWVIHKKMHFKNLCMRAFLSTKDVINNRKVCSVLTVCCDFSITLVRKPTKSQSKIAQRYQDTLFFANRRNPFASFGQVFAVLFVVHFLYSFNFSTRRERERDKTDKMKLKKAF